MTVAIAVNRFGLGARPDEALPRDGREWLLNQLGRYEARSTAWSDQPSTAAIATGYVEGMREVRVAQEDARARARREQRRENRNYYMDAVNARAASALATDTPFAERLVHFWANHFAVSMDKLPVVPFAGAFEAEAIRPHVLGRFEDILLAVERHPAMQLYLDQVQSIGPDSPVAARVGARNPQRKPGLNENLAREIMELHTLGVRTGYTQEDVTEFARALTGWSSGGLGRAARQDRATSGTFSFHPALHEPGVRTIMGKRYAQQGEAQARAVLHDLSASPATAAHIATKLARHFVADDPPAELVGQLAGVFQSSGGDLSSVYRALIEAPESWSDAGGKFKTPWEWLVSAMRGLGIREARDIQVAPILQQLGQAVWRPGSPAGFDDVAASWAGPDALVRRVELAQRMATRVGGRVDPRELGAKILPGVLSAATAQAISRAESKATGLALLLVAPEFLRR